MISADNIKTSVAARLDALESEHYTDDNDYIPAINSAVKYIMDLVVTAFGNNKFSEEDFREIHYKRIFQTSEYSRVTFDSSTLGHQVWTVTSVNPEPVMVPASPTITSTGVGESIYRNDVTYRDSNKWATRLTDEEWERNRRNKYKPGNIVETCPDLIQYSYKAATNYKSTAYIPIVDQEVQIRPELNRQLVGIGYLAVPADVTDISTGNLPFPISMQDLIVRRTSYEIIAKDPGHPNKQQFLTEFNQALQTYL